jgi:hypothetical protein
MAAKAAAAYHENDLSLENLFAAECPEKVVEDL